MLPVLAALASAGLGLITDAVIAKGKQVVETELGIKLPTTAPELTPEVTTKLLEVQNAHEAFLVTAALEAEKNSTAAEAAASAEVTARWQADTASDVMLAKVIRPSVLIYLLTGFTIAAGASVGGYVMPADYLAVLKELLYMVFAAYFVGRTTEKVASTVATMIKDWKAPK